MGAVAAVPVAYYSNVTLIGPETWFPFLGDVFVFPRPLPMATAFSLGDAVIAVGAVIFLVHAMRRSPTTAAAAAPTSAQPVAR